ncbi:hypothetical protein DM02DRAFT_170601 [Periconia macrospinosa]|uniref:Uncharacterized protein n=1 Tax=Periconia macrospinosa TaxID=97972 RepID=A0A2V1DBV2_9PLEO|nr:hypothetical protein DM02DRAFT_170601 [Periconia macrospinosa]
MMVSFSLSLSRVKRNITLLSLLLSTLTLLFHYALVHHYHHHLLLKTNHMYTAGFYPPSRVLSHSLPHAHALEIASTCLATHRYIHTYMCVNVRVCVVPDSTLPPSHGKIIHGNRD